MKSSGESTTDNSRGPRAQEMINGAVGYFGLTAEQRIHYFGS